jgi:4'-phosphopantetheinyl transferase
VASVVDVGDSLGRVSAERADAELWYAWVGRHVTDVDHLTRDVLSEQERARRARYRSRDAAERYVVTRALVRQVLARQLGRDPSAVELSRTDTGKPIVTGGVHFSISHSGDLILLALSRQCDIGVDVERRRDVPRVTELGERWLTAAERAEVARMAESNGEGDASHAFLRVWTRKEARLKALGVGISGAAMALDHVSAIPLDDLLSGCVDHAGRGYVGAIAFA